MGLGMKSLLEVGVEAKVQIKANSSAAKSIASRGAAARGARRIEVLKLWVQDRLAKEELLVVKGKGEDNVADGLTKRLHRQKMEQYMAACGMVRPSGRHELCPRLGDGSKCRGRFI